MNVGVNKLDNVELLNVGANAFHDMKKIFICQCKHELICILHFREHGPNHPIHMLALYGSNL